MYKFMHISSYSTFVLVSELRYSQ